MVCSTTVSSTSKQTTANHSKLERSSTGIKMFLFAAKGLSVAVKLGIAAGAAGVATAAAVIAADALDRNKRQTISPEYLQFDCEDQAEEGLVWLGDDEYAGLTVEDDDDDEYAGLTVKDDDDEDDDDDEYEDLEHFKECEDSGCTKCAVRYSAQTQQTYTNMSNPQEKDGFLTSKYHLGQVGTYSDLLRNFREWTRGNGKDRDKYVAAADHIPPLQSLRLARSHFDDHPDEDNPFYKYLMGAETDLLGNLRGRDLITMQVLTTHHLLALSSGNSTEARLCRKLVADAIIQRDVVRTFQLSFIIAHPLASQQIRRDAGFNITDQSIGIEMTPEGIMDYYREGFLGVIERFHQLGIISNKQRKELQRYVVHDMYLDRDDDMYAEIVRAIKQRFFYDLKTPKRRKF